MEPRIETLIEKKLVGKRMTMSLAENKTAILWQSFMPKRRRLIIELQMTYFQCRFTMNL